MIRFGCRMTVFFITIICKMETVAVVMDIKTVH